MRIYLACGLTHVPRGLFAEHAQFIHGLAAALRAHTPSHEVKYALVNSDPQLATKPFGERARLCYLWDREMVEQSDLVIAEVSFASIGVGIEMQIAQQQGTPIILCFKDYKNNRAAPVDYVNPDSTHHQLQIGDGFVTLMALGIPEIIKVIHYDSLQSGIEQILSAVELLEKT
jgi:nucleoside 2-deoxyribosyltransferase